MVTTALQRNDIVRLLALGILVIVEGLALVSTMLNIVIVPIGTLYPNVASVVIFVLPVIIGAVASRIEAAVTLNVLPFFILAVIYTSVYAPVWNIDLFQLGTLAGRVAGAMFLFGGLGAFGCMSRRALIRASRKRA
ncbi:MAG TPA: hypothetical protein VFN78_03775 [Ktedonobacterales bacterium]|nr:hypothetical protein [Ktedonobacterales bacterium]